MLCDVPEGTERYREYLKAKAMPNVLSNMRIYIVHRMFAYTVVLFGERFLNSNTIGVFQSQKKIFTASTVEISYCTSLPFIIDMKIIIRKDFANE